MSAKYNTIKTIRSIQDTVYWTVSSKMSLCSFNFKLFVQLCKDRILYSRYAANIYTYYY